VGPGLRVRRGRDGRDGAIAIEVEAMEGFGEEAWPAAARRVGEAVREELRLPVEAVLVARGTLADGPEPAGRPG
jgi:hypothetical protein